MASSTKTSPHWVDPQARFAESSGYLDFRRPDEPLPPAHSPYWPVILELHARTGVAALRQQGLEIPPAYDNTRYCTACLRQAQYEQLRAGGFADLVARWELQLPVIPLRPQPREASGVARVGASTANGPGGFPGSLGLGPAPMAGEILLGVIDTGCPFAHVALADIEGGTRILRLWDQDDRPAFGPLAGSAPASFGFGREVFRRELNRWIDRHRNGSGCVDEEGCYRNALYGMVSESFAHGAAVLSLLTGSRRLQDRYPCDSPDFTSPPDWRLATDPASRADIVFVQAPRDMVQDSSSAAMPRVMLDGLRYIVAARGPETRRIVVNISDGTSRSLHDGTSIIELAMEELVADIESEGQCRLDIVIAAGNSFDDRRHARVRPVATVPHGPSAGLAHDAVIRIPPDAESPQFLNIRIPPTLADPRIRVTPPWCGPEAAIELCPDGNLCWPAPLDASCWLAMQPRQSGGATYAIVVWAPTAHVGTTARARGVHGDWRIECLGTGAGENGEGDVQMWISLNQQNDGAVAAGRQARFVDVDGRYDPQCYLGASERDLHPPSVIQRSGTLSGLATLPPPADRATQRIWVVGSRLVRVGAGQAWTSLYSSTGPSADGRRQDVDGWCPTDFNRWSDGVRLGGTRSGQVLRATGTSFAPAQWIRALLEPHPPGAGPGTTLDRPFELTRAPVRRRPPGGRFVLVRR